MGQVALAVHLGLLPIGGRRQRHHAEHPRADPLGDGLDGPALAGAITALEDDADLEPLGHHPLLQFHQLDMQALELAFVLLATELFLFRRRVGGCLLLALCHDPLPR
ncbi:hypothetical protein D9M68_768150 [compost metagenome]